MKIGFHMIIFYVPKLQDYLYIAKAGESQV